MERSKLYLLYLGTKLTSKLKINDTQIESGLSTSFFLYNPEDFNYVTKDT